MWRFLSSDLNMKSAFVAQKQRLDASKLCEVFRRDLKEGSFISEVERASFKSVFRTIMTHCKVNDFYFEE